MKQPTERLQNELRSDSNISQHMNPNFAVLGMPSNYRKEDGKQPTLICTRRSIRVMAAFHICVK